MKILFNDNNGAETEITDIAFLKTVLIDNFEAFCQEGSGDGFIDCQLDDGNTVSLMIEPHPEYGIYLRYTDEATGDEMMSLGDSSRLSEVEEINDDIFASVGLFLPKEKAWQAIADLVTTGRPSDSIAWITPDEMPEDGNW